MSGYNEGMNSLPTPKVTVTLALTVPQARALDSCCRKLRMKRTAAARAMILRYLRAEEYLKGDLTWKEKE